MTLNIYSISAWVATSLIGCLTLAVFLGSKNYSSRIFVFVSFCVAMWAASMATLLGMEGGVLATILLRSNYVIGIAIALSFLYFSVVFPEDKKPKAWSFYIPVATWLIFIYLYFFTNLIIESTTWVMEVERWRWTYGPLWFLFDISFFGPWIMGLLIIYKKFKSATDEKLRLNLRYMLITLIIGVTPPALVNIILPNIGYYYYYWLGPITSIGWVFLLSYSIIKYRQMNVRVVAAEMFILIMAIILFVNIFITGITLEVVSKVFVFAAFMGIGYMFIKTILKEAKQKEQIETLNYKLLDLNTNLENKVEQQTKEIKKAYEVEKRAREELEELDITKDQFVLTTQHHLRTPLTILKGYIELLLTKPPQEFVEKTTDSLNKMKLAIDRLTKLINDFLDISQIKIGKKVLQKIPIDLRELTQNILKEFNNEIKKKNIEVTAKFPEDSTVLVDPVKFKEALSNVIDNAIKYNYENGYVIIKGERILHPIEKNQRIFRLTVNCTGIGISSDELSHIFTTYFKRGEEAQKVYTTGMGIGLALVKNIIQAHGGKIWAESEGRGKGATFIIELPI